MRDSKILIRPEFKPIPKSDAADVKENIQNWIAREKLGMIKTFCREDPTKEIGYRFVRAEDLDETIITNQTISKIPFKITWYRRLHTTDHFCPLYFSEWYTEVTLEHEETQTVFKFTSDNDIKNKIKLIKEKLKQL